MTFVGVSMFVKVDSCFSRPSLTGGECDRHSHGVAER